MARSTIAKDQRKEDEQHAGMERMMNELLAEVEHLRRRVEALERERRPLDAVSRSTP